MSSLPFRHMHMDFHTSEHIPDVAADFDPESFADTLARAHVQSVNLFARCWHGWLYYDSHCFRDHVHPSLKRRNLLAEQIVACQARGIRTPMYVGVQVCNATAERHPEWRQARSEDPAADTPPVVPGHRGPLCLNTPFADFMDTLVRELCDTMPAVDGFWFDGVNAQDCVCRACQTEMLAQGLDPDDDASRARFGHAAVTRWTRRMSDLVRALKPDATIFYNAGHLGPGQTAMGDAYTHWEVESIPFEGWGFTHSPAVTRYVRTTGKPVVGMSVRFHTGWGDLHSYKHPRELEFECFQMLALGARCAIGDHLHPCGRLDPAAYELIGGVFGQVADVEPWCTGAQPVCEAAVLSPESDVPLWGANEPPAIRGAVSLLQELAIQFDIVDGMADLAHYRLLILPDDIRLSADLALRVDAFVTAGGALLSSGVSGLTIEGSPRLACLGLERVGDAPWLPDFVRPRGAIGTGLPETDHTMYLRGQQVQALPGTEVLLDASRPYFNAEWSRYAGDRSTGETVYPAVTRRGTAIHFVHPVFRIYHANSAPWVKILVGNALKLLLGTPMVRHDGPSTLLAHLQVQADERRWVLHLLHYVPTRSGGLRERITDILPLHDLEMAVLLPGSIDGVRLEPQGQPLEFRQADGAVRFTVPCLTGHQLVVFSMTGGRAQPA
jgi:hypothetical protein